MENMVTVAASVSVPGPALRDVTQHVVPRSSSMKRICLKLIQVRRRIVVKYLVCIQIILIFAQQSGR